MAVHVHTIHAHGEIHATPADVWPVLTDVGRHSEILGSVTRSELLTDGPYDVGTRWRESRHLFDHKGVEELEVVELNPGIHTTHRTKLGHDVIDIAYNLSALRSGTRVSITATAHMEGRGPLDHLAWRAFGGFDQHQTRQMFEKDIDDFAAEVARHTQPSGS
jgi:hypothetical protein